MSNVRIASADFKRVSCRDCIVARFSSQKSYAGAAFCMYTSPLPASAKPLAQILTKYSPKGV